MASGMVMSVPAHAPFDYIALRDLQQAGKYKDIKPIPLIKVEGYGEVPAQFAVEKAGIANQMDSRMDALTQEIYSAEFSKGKLFEKYGGKPVRVARDDVAALMTEKYDSVVMYEFDVRPVVCRCGNKVKVKILHDQWFLKYSDPAWKQEVKDCLKDMALVPPEVRVEFDRTVDWLKDWACTRRVGLGTRFPWDKAQLIEPLSDSTVYMAYYTIAHKIRDIDSKLLTPEVFDYIFLGKKSPDLPEKKKLDAMREEFLYWYPYDFRFSAKDLISNHLTFQLFHHVTVFEGQKDKLPKGMVVFGMGLLNGAKMSSSKGNVFLLEDAVQEFGADTVRMFLMGSAEPWQDFDWRNELVLSTKKQIERFYTTVMETKDAGGEPHDIDRWLASRLQLHIAKTTEALDNFQTRQALQEAYFGIENDLKWYRRRLPEDCDGSREPPRALLGVGPAPRPLHPVHGRAPLEGTRGRRPLLVCPLAGGGRPARQREGRARRGTPRPHGRGRRVDQETDPAHPHGDHDRPRSRMEARDLPHDRPCRGQELRDQGDHEGRKDAETRQGGHRCGEAVHHPYPPPAPARGRPAGPRPDQRAGGLRVRKGLPRAGVRRPGPHCRGGDERPCQSADRPAVQAVDHY